MLQSERRAIDSSASIRQNYQTQSRASELGGRAWECLQSLSGDGIIPGYILSLQAGG